jgi:hypothetical protein
VFYLLAFLERRIARTLKLTLMKEEVFPFFRLDKLAATVCD